MADYVGAIDQGTTSTRFMIFDHDGNEVAKHQLEHEQVLPQAGWVEHNPVEIWERSTSVVQSALNKASLQVSDLAALGITNQRETTVVWDKTTGRPYYNAIVWQDTRTDKIASKLDREGKGDLIKQKAGLPPATYFSGGKIQWILENVDGVREAAEKGDAIFGNTDCWLLWNMTGGKNGGVHVTDVTNASRTMLMNLETLDWDDELLSLFNIPREMLPEIKPSSFADGYGEGTGSFEGVPLTGDLGDQQAAMFGQVCFAPGEAKNTYGTGNFLLLNTGTELVRSENGLLTTVCYKIGDEDPVYALEGSIAVTGSAVQWLRDQLGIISGASEIESLARRVDDNGGVYFVPAFSGLFAPYWRSRRARRDRRAVALQHQRAPGAGDARGDLLPEPRGVRGDGGRLRRPRRRAQGRRRRDRERAVHAAAGRHPRRAGQPAGRRRDDRARRRVRRGSRGRVLERTPTSCARTGTSPSAGSRSGRTSSARKGTPAGRRRSSALSTGWTSTDRHNRPMTSTGSNLGPDDRAEALRRLATEELDVLIIGGGVVGAGAALDAVTRGLRVGLIEARDYASGTSSRSTKLFHGGLRYLEQFDFHLVFEALKERGLVLNKLCPHLAKPVPLIYPLEKPPRPCVRRHGHRRVRRHGRRTRACRTTSSTWASARRWSRSRPARARRSAARSGSTRARSTTRGTP